MGGVSRRTPSVEGWGHLWNMPLGRAVPTMAARRTERAIVHGSACMWGVQRHVGAFRTQPPVPRRPYLFPVLRFTSCTNLVPPWMQRGSRVGDERASWGPSFPAWSLPPCGEKIRVGGMRWRPGLLAITCGRDSMVDAEVTKVSGCCGVG